MKNKFKKWSIVSAVSVICVVLIAVIAWQLQPKPAVDDLTPQDQIEADVNPVANENDVVIAPNDDETPNNADGAKGGVSTGTEQTIQPDPVKPTPPSESQKTNPAQKPNGEKVSTPPIAEDHDTVKPPTTTTKPNEPKGGDKNSKGEVYVPGFGWVKESGGEGKAVDSDGDINKQVGTMD